MPGPRTATKVRPNCASIGDHEPDIPYRITLTVVDNSTVNAFAAPAARS